MVECNTTSQATDRRTSTDSSTNMLGMRKPRTYPPILQQDPTTGEMGYRSSSTGTIVNGAINHMGQCVRMCIDVRIEGQPVRTLIDTGSDITIVDSSFAHKMQWHIRPARITSVKTASGKGMIIDGICTTDLIVSCKDITPTY